MTTSPASTTTSIPRGRSASAGQARPGWGSSPLRAAPSDRGDSAPAVEVAIVGDDPLVNNGLRAMLRSYVDVVALGVSKLEDTHPDPVDLTLYDPTRQSSGAQRMEGLMRDAARGLVVMYALAPPRQMVTEMLARGCAGFVDKAVSAPELVGALVSLTQGRQHASSEDPTPDQRWPGKDAGLSRRESEMIRLIAQGLTNDEISVRVHLSINTVKSYIRSAYRKLGITRRPEAVRWALSTGQLERSSTARRPGPG